MKPSPPILVSNNDLATRPDEIQSQGGRVWAMDIVPGGYNLHVNELPKTPQCNSGTTQSRPYPTRAVKGEASAGHMMRTSAAAGGDTRPEKVKRVNDSPASIYEVKQMAAGDGNLESESVLGSCETTDNPAVTISIAQRLAALRDRLVASGRVRPSRTKEARMPHNDP